MALRLVANMDESHDGQPGDGVADDADGFAAPPTLPEDPRDPRLYRSGLSSARAALRDGRARRQGRVLEDGFDDAHEDRIGYADRYRRGVDADA